MTRLLYDPVGLFPKGATSFTQSFPPVWSSPCLSNLSGFHCPAWPCCFPTLPRLSPNHSLWLCCTFYLECSCLRFSYSFLLHIIQIIVQFYLFTRAFPKLLTKSNKSISKLLLYLIFLLALITIWNYIHLFTELYSFGICFLTIDSLLHKAKDFLCSQLCTHCLEQCSPPGMWGRN